MGFLTEWIMNIVVFILLAMIVDMLLPNSNMKKYTKMVIGLLLIAIILTPLLNVVSKDFDQIFTSLTDKSFINNSEIENSIEMKKKEIQASQAAYTLKYTENQLKKDVEEELIERFGKNIQSIEIKEADESKEHNNQIEKVIVYLEEAKDKEAVSVIEPIEINTDKPDRIDHDSAEKQSILSVLTKRWELNDQQVEVHMEGGDS